MTHTAEHDYVVSVLQMDLYSTATKCVVCVLLWTIACVYEVVMSVTTVVLLASFHPGFENPLENTNTPALVEDEVLRGFAPLVRTQELLDYSATAQSPSQEQVRSVHMSMCVLYVRSMCVHTRLCACAGVSNVSAACKHGVSVCVAGGLGMCFSQWLMYPSCVPVSTCVLAYVVHIACTYVRIYCICMTCSMCALPDCHVPLILSLQAVTRLFYLHRFGQFIGHAKVGTVVQSVHRGEPYSPQCVFVRCLSLPCRPPPRSLLMRAVRNT